MAIDDQESAQIDGDWTDEVLMGLLRTDFEASERSWRGAERSA